ncbi:excinuclease ABC subunit C [candidate division KSB1 bacterium]|nr:excinuclease ABC subunit C [candidate division KSB1 bacterium]RQW05574.1 MAG: excinuclease ABC subunit C [candidate division KSB1 bacterium]
MLKSLSKNLQEKLDNLSRKPGVYIYKDKRDDIIYIGKAKVLRNRVRSYFQDGHVDAKTRHLVSRIHDIETIITDTEVEALILEANLVKEHKPRYNINLKDDKSFPYIRVTNEPFPRIFPTRKIVKDGSRYFGPYTNVIRMKALLTTIKKIFPIRSCNLPLNDKTISVKKFKVCLNYHIHRCNGPCEGFVSREEYNRTISYIIDFIKGNTRQVERDIRERMLDLSEKLRFEEAARLRDQLHSITMFSERQKVLDNQFGDRDIIATASDDGDACCVVFRVREGKIVSKDHFYLENAHGENIAAITQVFLQQFYLKVEDVPPEILVPCHFGQDHNSLQKWLEQKGNKRLDLIFPRRGEKARLLEMCTRNATHHLEELKLKKMQSKEYIAGSVKALQKALQLEKPPRRIEGFDISNIQGTNPVASMVCFMNGRPAKGEYRRFKIRSKQSPDDFAMMHEVVKRRYTRLLKERKNMPDLILIDGGKGQLNAALAALGELGLDSQPIVALAKRLDQVFKPGYSDPQNVPHDSAGLKLLQRVRDESHRFAVTYHRSLRKKRTLTSELKNIPGIGEKRKTALLKHFRSVENIKAASVEDLAGVDSITPKQARLIYTHLHGDN